MILEKIKKPNDIHKIPLEDFEPLAAEIRDFLIRSVSQTGGHLASNLGVVELTLALHNVLDFPEDKLIWDVGHQAYTHKILPGIKSCLTLLLVFLIVSTRAVPTFGTFFSAFVTPIFIPV